MTDTPRCRCHDELMRWQTDRRKRAGGGWCCAVKRAESEARYVASEKRRASRRAYERTEKGRVRKARYQATDAARSSKQLYEIARVRMPDRVKMI